MPPYTQPGLKSATERALNICSQYKSYYAPVAFLLLLRRQLWLKLLNKSHVPCFFSLLYSSFSFIPLCNLTLLPVLPLSLASFHCHLYPCPLSDPPLCVHLWCPFSLAPSLLPFLSGPFSLALPLMPLSAAFKGTQDWEFFWLRFWILCYFIVSYA